MKTLFPLIISACASTALAQTNAVVQTNPPVQTNAIVQSQPTTQTNAVTPPSSATQTNAVMQPNTVTLTNAPEETKSIDIDGYAAKVNDRVITIGEVREAMAPLLPEIYRTYQGSALEAQVEKAFNQTRDELVDQALILEAFKARGGKIPDQYVDDEVKRIIKDRFKGDSALFEQVLAKQKMTREEYKDTIRDQMAVGMMANQEVTQRARVTPEQIRDYYEAHKDTDYAIPETVKYSVIAFNKGETPEDQKVKMAEAKKIRKKLLDGADFAETAKAVSEGSHATDGGAYPPMQPKDARPEWRDTLEKLPSGKISDIIVTDSQLFIIKIAERKYAGYTPFDQVRDAIEKQLLMQERQRLRERWIERLKEKSYVKIYEQ